MSEVKPVYIDVEHLENMYLQMVAANERNMKKKHVAQFKLAAQETEMALDKSELEVYAKFAEQFGDLSCCYDAKDVTSVIKTAFEELKAQNKLLVEALEFYGDKKHWQSLSSPEGHEGYVARFSLTSDHGKLAREVLRKVKG